MSEDTQKPVTIDITHEDVSQKIITTIKHMLISTFVFTGIMSLIIYLLLTCVFVLITRSDDSKIIDTTFQEISRARGELLEEIVKERHEIYMLQQSTLIYSDSIDAIDKRLSEVENQFHNKRCTATVVIPKAKIDKDTKVEESKPAVPADAPPVPKKSFWSKLAFWK